MTYNIQTTLFTNDLFNISVNEKCIFVFALGYEERSVFIIDKILKMPVHNNITIVPFIFDDYIPSEPTSKIIELLATYNITPINVAYNDYNKVLETVAAIVNNISGKDIILHFDYSSMPRSWYCRFPMLVKNHHGALCKLYFWYSAGDYESNGDGFPSAGVRDIRSFSGRATLRPINSRTHIFGLGFDHVRTQGIMSVLDPSYYGACYAYPFSDFSMLKKVKKENEELINSSDFSFELPLHDFHFMMAKLSDLANTLVHKGDVIFIPDGPKPLILACSLVPTVVPRKGVVCLHVKRHDQYYEAVNVKAKGDIFGFCYESYLPSADCIL